MTSRMLLFHILLASGPPVVTGCALSGLRSQPLTPNRCGTPLRGLFPIGRSPHALFSVGLRSYDTTSNSFTRASMRASFSVAVAIGRLLMYTFFTPLFKRA